MKVMNEVEHNFVNKAAHKMLAKLSTGGNSTRKINFT
jgi:hypothetical protein